MIRRLYRLCIFLALSFFVFSCAPTAKVTVLRPAQINMNGRQKIIVGMIEGNIGKRVADLLGTKLYESDYFKVLDRDHIDQLLKEHKLSLSGLTIQDNAIQIGQLIGANAIIFGNSRAVYREKKWRSKANKTKDGKIYYEYYIKGTARIKTTFKIVDLGSGVIIAAKSLNKEASLENSQRDSWPVRPDRDDLTEQALDKTLNQFMKMIAPYEEQVRVEFAKSKVSEVESGIEFAKQGLWPDALEQFKTAARNHPNDADVLFNLAIGYEYNDLFDQAVATLKQANQIKPDKKYAVEIQHVRELIQERKELMDQGIGP